MTTSLLPLEMPTSHSINAEMYILETLQFYNLGSISQMKYVLFTIAVLTSLTLTTENTSTSYSMCA